MKRQRALYQMKEQDNPPRKTTKRSGARQPSRKRIQNNDSEDDPGPQKKRMGIKKTYKNKSKTRKWQ